MDAKMEAAYGQWGAEKEDRPTFDMVITADNKKKHYSELQEEIQREHGELLYPTTRSPFAIYLEKSA